MDRITNTRRSLSLLMLLGLLIPLAGCGDGRPARVRVSGQVLIDGQPLTTGNIRIVPDNARPAVGTIDENGRFTLTTFKPDDGCVPGTHAVEVVALEDAGQGQIRRLVPEKYNEVGTSGLTVTIDGPTDSLVIELSREGERPSQFLDGAGDVDPSAQ